MMSVKNVKPYLRGILLLWKFLGYLVCVTSFGSSNSSSLSKKDYDGSNFTLTPLSAITRSKYVGGNRVNEAYLDIWYIELEAIFQTLHFTKYFTHIFIVYICVEQNLLFKKLSGVLVWFEMIFDVARLKVLCFWCSLCKVI